MSSQWITTTIDEACNVEYGTRVVKKRDGGSRYPVYGGGGATFQMDLHNREDRVVIARFGMSPQCVRRVEGKFFLNDSGLTISPKNPDCLIQSYLDYFAFSLNDAIYRLGKGQAQKNLDVPAFRALPLAYPSSIVEQKRIVTTLENAFAGIEIAIANTTSILNIVGDLFDSAVLEQFLDTTIDWRIKTLPEVATYFGRGKSKHRPRNDPTLFGGPYPFIQTGDVRNADHEITEFKQTYSEVGLEQSRLWKKGTTCITIAANIAETAVLGFDACFPDSVIGFEADESKTSGKYVEYAFSTVRQRLKSMGKGNAQDNINLASFDDIRLPFPDLDTQQEIVKRLEKLRHLRNTQLKTYQAKLDAIHDLRGSLMNTAFNSRMELSEA